MKKTISTYLAKHRCITHWATSVIYIAISIIWTYIHSTTYAYPSIWWVSMIPMAVAYREIFVAIYFIIKELREEKRANKH